MSELKAYKFLGIDEIYPDANLSSDYYLKSEADKAIAELKADYKEACDRLQTANLIKDEQLAATRHSNYKRCLAMARWCGSEVFVSDYEKDEPRMRWFVKWHKRWLELAEKFKEAK